MQSTSFTRRAGGSSSERSLPIGWGLAFVLSCALVSGACDSGGENANEMENHPPTAKADTFSAAPAAKLSVQRSGVLRNDSDPNEDDLNVSTTPVSSVSNGSLTLNADGTFEYTSDQGFVGEDKFTYEVTDGNGGTDRATATIAVLNVDYAVDIQPIFDSSCGGGGCHIDQTTNGVHLSSKDAVLDSRGDQYGRPIVEPGEASRVASPLIDKILPAPGVGVRMPFNQAPLTDEQIRDIRAWIESLDPEV